MRIKKIAVLPLIALRLTGCDFNRHDTSDVSVLKGDKGDEGDPGLPGKDGNLLLTGEGTPSSSLGKDGDSYVNTLTWDYYTKADGKWIKAGNIKGEKGNKGDVGAKGDPGLPGKNGNIILTGKGVPSSFLGKDGDSYVDTQTWDYYTKSNGKWTKTGNFKGGNGDNGSQGSRGDDAVTYIPCIFKNYDGTTLYEFYYEKGTDVVYDGPAPEKEEKDENGKDIPWTFVGWDKSLENIQKPTIFTAKFECLYTCTFLNYDGSALYSAKVNRGEDVSYEGDTPLKPDTVDGETTIHWTFTGWDKDLTDIKADTIFTAQFDSPNAIKCTFLNYDGTLLGYSYCGKGATAVYHGDTPTRKDTSQDGVITSYRFLGWDKPLDSITESTTFKAVYETYDSSYECKFVNYNGDLLCSTLVPYGGYAYYEGVVPSRYSVYGKNEDGTTNVTSYKFKGWDKSLYGITAPTTFTATYAEDETYSGYRVEFKNKDGSEICHTYTKKGGNAVCSYEGIKDLISSSYLYDSENVTMFAGWNQSTSDVQSDLVLTANIATISRKQNGEYPQTKVTDNDLISKLDLITETDFQEYYSYGGEKYQKTQNGQAITWRKVEPIQWHYLSQNGDNVQFVSEKVLDSHVWNQTGHENGIYPNNYQYSDIRTWLNNDFLEQAFYYDSSLIQTVNVDNSTKRTGDSSNPFACEYTQDKVCLLCCKDINDEDYGFTDDASRITYDADGEAQDYWLRSPNCYDFGGDSGAYYVNLHGRLSSSYNNVHSFSGVRPALTRKLD